MSRLVNTRKVKLNEFDTRVQIITQTASQTDNFGYEQTETVLDTVYAKVEYMSRKTQEDTEGGREISMQQIKFLMRYNANVEKTSKLKIVDTGKEFDIIAIYDDVGRRQYMEIIAELRE